MKIWHTIILTLTLHSSGIRADDPVNGSTLFKQNCGSCHAQNDSENARVAPPIVAVKDHYISVHTDRKAFVSALVDWVTTPSSDKTLMPGAIRRFGLMPALPYPKEDLVAIAEFLYDEKIEKPDWYKKHYKAEHGSKPSGKAPSEHRSDNVKEHD